MRPGEIRIEELGKRYWFQSAADDQDGELDDPDDDLGDTAAAKLVSLFRGQKSELWALRNISCHIRPGERVAIVGANGSGKSTLIQILSRILPPSEGSVTGAGIVVPFGALKKPLAPHASGCENLRMLARLLGVPLGHLEERLPDILAFSGIGKHAYEKVSRYSERSYGRLSMAMAVLIDADIYLVDDDLKAGDDLYRDKFEEKLAEVLQRNVTLVYASNNLGQVRLYCRRGLWLSQGRLVADGEVNAVIQRFLATSDDAIDFEDLAATLQSDDARELIAKAAEHPPGTVPADRLEPVSDWVEHVARAESAWHTVLGRWREKIRPSDLSNIGSLTLSDSRNFGTIQTLRCLNSAGNPIRHCLPAEGLFVELVVETFKPDVRVSVRLELDAVPTLILVAEPIVPLTAARSGQYLFRVELPSGLFAQIADSMMMKLRTRVTFGLPTEGNREMASATVRIDLRGDIRHRFDEQRRANGEPATSVIDPAPAYIQAPDAIEGDGSESLPPPSPLLTRAAYLSRQPLLRPRLDWMVYRVLDRPAEAASRDVLPAPVPASS